VSIKCGSNVNFTNLFLGNGKYQNLSTASCCWKPKKGLADGPALRPDGPRFGLSVVVARTIRACAETVRVPSSFCNYLTRRRNLSFSPALSSNFFSFILLSG
jgi:hypothetical protein